VSRVGVSVPEQTKVPVYQKKLGLLRVLLILRAANYYGVAINVIGGPPPSAAVRAESERARGVQPAGVAT
jgi:hypothetical protein